MIYNKGAKLRVQDNRLLESNGDKKEPFDVKILDVTQTSYTVQLPTGATTFMKGTFDNRFLVLEVLDEGRTIMFD